MQQKISYNGISFRPDDYSCADGELTTAVNLINEAGALRAIEKPRRMFGLNAGERLLYIHRAGNRTNYIIYAEGFYYIPEGHSPGEKKFICDAAYSDKALNSLVVTSMGNTLIITDDGGTNYFLFKNDGYKDLGRKPPFASLTFGLNGDFETGELIKKVIDGHVGSDTVPPSARDKSFSLKDITAGGQDYVNWIIGELTNNTLANVNKFIREKATDRNKFIFPFLVRYAYRLYDGSHIMHSYPVLMVPVNGCNPVFFADRMNCHDDGDKQTQLNIGGYTSALLCNLDYTFNGYIHDGSGHTVNDESMEVWKDIVKCIDIFVTAPVYTYDQNGKVYGWRRLADNEKHGNYAIAKINNPSAKWKQDRPADTRYGSHGNHLYEYQFMCAHDYIQKALQDTSGAVELLPGFQFPRYFLELPQVKEGEWIKNIQEASVFYRIASLDFSELKDDNRTYDINIKDNILKTLQNQPVLKDDFKTHCRISGKCAYVYNSRLNIGNITERLYNGTPVDTQFTRWDTYDGGNGIGGKVKIFVHIKKDNGEYTVEAPEGRRTNHSDFYFFYPDADAYGITVARYGTANEIVRLDSIPLTPHTLLNGSYYFRGFQPALKSAVSLPAVSEKTEIYHPSKIYTSEVNNPFLFLPTGMNSVGNGGIIALCSATKAISEGQFGQFPMHAFTTEGIWALEVNGTGGYTSRQPVTRDVIRGSHVLQLDQALAYPTDKGIMLLRGGASACITSVLDGKFNSSDIVKYMHIAGEFGFEDHNIDYDFRKFIIDCVLAYDYVNSRIYISNNDYGYSYVYSMLSEKWSIVTESFANTVNSYPDSVVTVRPVQRSDDPVREEVYKLAGKEYYSSGMIITRPIKLGEADAVKTISSVVPRGTYTRRNGIMKTVLLGSTDGISYIPVASSQSGEIRNVHGSGYKFFRLMHEWRPEGNEYFKGVSVEYESKRTNKLR